MHAVILKSTSQSEPIASSTPFYGSHARRVSKSKGTMWLVTTEPSAAHTPHPGALLSTGQQASSQIVPWTRQDR